MRSRFAEINKHVVRVRSELQERERLLDEIERAEGQRKSLKREIARLNERISRQREQLRDMRRDRTTGAEWLQKIQTRRAQLEHDEREVERRRSGVRYIIERIVEFENRLVDLADSDIELAFLRAEQLALLVDWAQVHHSILNRGKITEFQELLSTIADAEAHIRELNEAIVFGEKAHNSLRKLLDQVWFVWKSPNDYRLGREINKISSLLQQAEPRLDWFQRELWDVDRQFRPNPVINHRIFYQDDNNHHAEAAPAPRVDPAPIEKISREVWSKIVTLRQELQDINEMLVRLEEQKMGMVDELWSEKTFR